ncbi:HAD-IA family hydrolase [Pseudoponticoccus marisrubri]|uniref:HAD family hydrolase n=1 Tax=Pseudoponticoccus marisrubri TaxID=1685382 RepID=A0A0W7WPN2_9RHOB|nr:HAD-IA family hydrolase [Pseudoponticoccus marisrubri]KUF12497.1 HAD family hydrolase [Pseudoponticoccus marisrubri]
MTDLSLVIFDVDGTLVDSQGDILASMRAAFGAEGLPVPERAAVLGIVGLSLPMAIAALAPGLPQAQLDRMVETYKDSYADLRRRGGPDSSPLYAGLPELLDRLGAREDLLLGVATGKSRRGLTALLESHGLTRRFVTTQVADDHPSKPHPAMLFAALAETGVEESRAVMIGDTEYDMDMARAAGLHAIGVSWGYHPRARLGAAHAVVDDAAGLERAIHRILGDAR